jgi:hypothetical protein
MQELFPWEPWKRPAAHALQVPLPLSLNLPAAQFEHDIDPLVFALCIPALHDSQRSAPAAAVNLPASHSEHVLAPAPLKAPAVQFVQPAFATAA